MIDEQFITRGKDKVQNYYIQQNKPLLLTDVFLLEYKSDSLRENYFAKFVVRGETDIFVYKMNALSDESSFEHIDNGNAMYEGSGK